MSLDYTYPTIDTANGVTMKGRSSSSEMSAAVSAFSSVAQSIVGIDATLSAGFATRVSDGYNTLKGAIEFGVPTEPDLGTVTEPNLSNLTAPDLSTLSAPTFNSSYLSQITSRSVSVDTPAILAQYGMAMSSMFGGGHNNAYAYSTILGFEQKYKAEELVMKSLSYGLDTEMKTYDMEMKAYQIETSIKDLETRAYEIKVRAKDLEMKAYEIKTNLKTRAYETKMTFKSNSNNQALSAASSVPIINPADITLVSDVNASNVEAYNALQIRAQQIRQSKAAGAVLATVSPDIGTNPRPFEEIMTSASIRAVGAASNTE